MDITKWKSVLVPIEVYTEIKKTAKAEGRTISGQLKIVWEVYRKSMDNESKSIKRVTPKGVILSTFNFQQFQLSKFKSIENLAKSFEIYGNLWKSC